MSRIVAYLLRGLMLAALIGVISPHHAPALWAAAPYKYPIVYWAGQIGGSPHVVAASGSYAYVGVGTRLVIMDLSDPARPRPISETEPLFDKLISGITLSGRYAYVTGYSKHFSRKLRIIDISDPKAPQVLNDFVSLAKGLPDVMEIDSAAVFEQYVYVTALSLFIIDASDPTLPKAIREIRLEDPAFEVEVQGKYLYVISFNSLTVFDLANPADPQPVGTFRTSVGLDGGSISGNHAYLVSEKGLHILDISDPREPREIALFQTDSGAADVIASNGYAYVIAGGRVIAVDVRDPRNPHAIGGVHLSYYRGLRRNQNLAVSGNYLYIADMSGGFITAEISNSQKIEITDIYKFPVMFDAALSDHYIYAAAGSAGLWVIDLADPMGPRRISSLQLPPLKEYGREFPRFVGAVETTGPYALMLASGGLFVADLSEPKNPHLIGQLEISYPSYIHILGNYAYVLADRPGTQLHIIDISDPRNPQHVGVFDFHTFPSIPSQFNIQNVKFHDQHLFILSYTGHMLTLDLSDPKSPRPAGVYKLPAGVGDIAFFGHHIYAATTNGLLRLDASDPTIPHRLSSTVVRHVAITDQYLITASDSEIEIMDLANPTAPQGFDNFETPGNILFIKTAKNYIFVIDELAGLMILQLTETLPRPILRRGVSPMATLTPPALTPLVHTPTSPATALPAQTSTPQRMDRGPGCQRLP